MIQMQNADPVTDTQPNTGVNGRWTYEENAKLNSAVTSTCKKKHGKKYRKDWVAITALVPGRTRDQCRKRWYGVLDPNIGIVNGRMGRWRVDEDSKLTSTIQMHDGKDWVAAVALIPGRTRSQCLSSSFLVEREVSVLADGRMSWIGGVDEQPIMNSRRRHQANLFGINSWSQELR
jgi:hypothetical protein